MQLGDTAAMAQDIVEASQSIDSLLRQLPQAFGTEEEDLQRVDALQKERADMYKQVQNAWTHAEQALLEVQGVHSSLAEGLLGCPRELDHR